ncbi:SubName: Full=Uncharacterized protein {ECO:0000313/EMBL:CCA70716.1} [Serendipita indica DSM 11827]|uniref:Uncharacterized protein n=1 Tax=Serendipita indica (strain DSM 11827) TaxID=1109443 RepID=G4THD0_SERID|nr:SubName: Full=Uncharacterized protein {ECO:0000313/EMBL:CCA70716.1} [Serendipita indica DSM 11827]CCA70716.1 hypothetical protein PIIN_04650 [Serendipita indica DSM 11827]
MATVTTPPPAPSPINTQVAVHSNVLNDIEEHFASTPNIGEMVTTSCQIFQRLEPWGSVRSNHAKAQAVIPGVKRAVVSHCKTLDLSVQVSENGYLLADSGAALFDYLENAESYSLDEMRDYFEQVTIESKELEESTKTTVAAIRADRTKLIQVKDEIRNAVQAIDKERADNEQAIASARSWSRFLGGASAAINTVGHLPRMLPENEETQALVVLLPLLITVLDWGIVHLRESSESNIIERKAGVQSCGDAISKLEAAVEDLQAFETHMDNIAAFWIKVQMVLHRICRGLDALNRDRVARYRFKKIKEDFITARENFLLYKTGIVRLRDYFPPQITD